MVVVNCLSKFTHIILMTSDVIEEWPDYSETTSGNSMVYQKR